MGLDLGNTPVNVIESGSEDEEELQLDYDEKCAEVMELKAEVRASKLEAQQLRLRLQAAERSRGTSTLAGARGALGPTLPAALPLAPAPGPAAPDGAQVARAARARELRPLISWLAAHTAIDLPAEILDVGFEVPVSGRTVHLQRVAQWPLSGLQGSRLRLSAPVEHQEMVLQLLAGAKARGNVPEPVALQQFAECWDLVPGEVTTAAHVRAEPAVLLAHRSSMQGILVATWPSREALEAFHALHARNGDVPRVGDRVEVEYEGDWYVGVLHSIDAAGKASVKCDVDEPGVLTIAPLQRVKHVGATLPGDVSVAAASAAGAGHTQGEGGLGGVEPCGCGQAVERLRQRLLTDQPTASSSQVGHRRTRSAT